MKLLIAFILLLAGPEVGWAWGRRGHQMVGEIATDLVAGTEGAEDLRGHSFDIGYYANVPDIIWKRPATYESERPQHFADMEIFEREIPDPAALKAALLLSREEFEAKYPKVERGAGRVFWRIRELRDKLAGLAAELRAMPLDNKARREIQARWLLIAGVLAHYVGDMTSPLHVSENYDGQLTGQKGVHRFYEDLCVDEIWPQVLAKVNLQSHKEWPGFKKKYASTPLNELLLMLVTHSKKELPLLLATDKKLGRKERKRICAKHEPMIVRGMVQSILVLAEIYRRELGWKFDDERFYLFTGEPEFIPPGSAPSPAPVAPAKSSE